MRVFEVVSIRGCDEFQSYLGVDFEKAMSTYNNECLNFSKMSESDKKLTTIEPRVYTIDDDVDINDVDELTNALIDCIGCDFFADLVK